MVLNVWVITYGLLVPITRFDLSLQSPVVVMFGTSDQGAYSIRAPSRCLEAVQPTSDTSSTSHYFLGGSCTVRLSYSSEKSCNSRILFIGIEFVN